MIWLQISRVYVIPKQCGIKLDAPLISTYSQLITPVFYLYKQNEINQDADHPVSVQK